MGFLRSKPQVFADQHTITVHYLSKPSNRNSYWDSRRRQLLRCKCHHTSFVASLVASRNFDTDLSSLRKHPTVDFVCNLKRISCCFDHKYQSNHKYLSNHTQPNSDRQKLLLPNNYYFNRKQPHLNYPNYTTAPQVDHTTAQQVDHTTAPIKLDFCNILPIAKLTALQ